MSFLRETYTSAVVSGRYLISDTPSVCSRPQIISCSHLYDGIVCVSLKPKLRPTEKRLELRGRQNHYETRWVIGKLFNKKTTFICSTKTTNYLDSTSELVHLLSSPITPVYNSVVTVTVTCFCFLVPGATVVTLQRLSWFGSHTGRRGEIIHSLLKVTPNSVKLSLKGNERRVS